MNERPATLADIRVGVWRLIRGQQSDEVVRDALRLLQAVDAAEARDAAGARYVGRILADSVTYDGLDGALHLRRRDPKEVVR